MERVSKKSSVAVFILRSLLVSYLITGGCLLLLALLLYRFQLSESVVSIAIIIVYIISTYFAGYITGKKMGTRKFLWGLGMGVSYFLIMIVVSLIVNHSIQDVSSNVLTTFLLCSGAGMLGGMLS